MHFQWKSVPLSFLMFCTGDSCSPGSCDLALFFDRSSGDPSYAAAWLERPERACVWPCLRVRTAFLLVGVGCRRLQSPGVFSPARPRTVCRTRILRCCVPAASQARAVDLFDASSSTFVFFTRPLPFIGASPLPLSRACGHGGRTCSR